MNTVVSSIDIELFDPLKAKWETSFEHFEEYLITQSTTRDLQTRKKLAYLKVKGCEKITEMLKISPRKVVLAGRSVSMIEHDEYVEVKVRLSDHLEERYNAVAKIMRFREPKQERGERIKAYEMRLRRQAAICGFHDKEREILIQLIQHTTDENLRLKYNRNRNMTLDDVLETATRNETSNVANRRLLAGDKLSTAVSR